VLPANPTPSVERLYRKVSLRLVPFLFVCYICAYLDRVNIGFAKLQMSAALSFSETVYGFGAGVFFLGYFLCEVPSNLLVHRHGARRSLARIMIFWGLISIAMAWVQTPLQFYLLRFLLGVAEAGFFPGVILYLTYWFPAARRGRVTAWFVTAVAAAGVVGGPVSGFILQHLDGVGAYAGWQWLFVLEGLPSVALGLLTLRYLDDRIDDACWLSPAEQSVLRDALAEDSHSVPHTRVADGLRLPRVWLLSLIYFAFVSGLYGLNFWLPTILSELGYRGFMEVGLVSAVPFTVAAVVMVLISRHADRTRERRWHIVLPACAGSAGLAASVALSSYPGLAVVALTVGTCGVLASIPQCWSLATAFLTSGAAAAGIALINSFGNLSGFVSPFAIGWIKDATGDTASGIYLLAIALVAGALLVLRLPARLVNR
jgi:sugar phosphate permease